MPVTSQTIDALRVDFQATLDGAREAVQAVIEWFGARGLSDDECHAWKLVLAEATTNAVVHSESDTSLWLDACSSSLITEVSVTDHGAGFDWPEDVALPEDDESEGGRGLFIIQSLTDHVSYLRGRGENRLRMVRKRLTASEPSEDLAATLDLMTGEVTACYETLANIFRLSAEAARDVASDALAAKWLEDLRLISGADFIILRILKTDTSQLECIATAPDGAVATPLIDLSDSGTIEGRAALSRMDQWFDGSTVFQESDPLSCRESAVSGFSHPIEVGGHLVGVLTLGVVLPQWEPKARDINVVRSLGDFLGTLLHSLRSRDESSHSRLIKRELQIAADIQRSLLPVELPQSATLQCAGHLTTVGEVGGDFLDGIAVEDGGRLFVIADVMGKGVPAALFATAFRSILHSHLKLAAQPGELMQRLNSSLFNDLDRADMFITAQLAYVSADGLTMRTCGAGHGPLLLANHSQVIEAGADGPPLGIVADTPYAQHEISLSGITHVLMHTDGLSDPAAPPENGLGRDMLHQWLQATAVEGIDAWGGRDSLLHMHGLHQHHSRPHDDATFVLLVRENGLLANPLPKTLTHVHR